MSDMAHHYQGRQSALQVFHEFAGSPGDAGDTVEDENDEEEEQVPML
jgi:hypothetical protein